MHKIGGKIVVKESGVHETFAVGRSKKQQIQRFSVNQYHWEPLA